MSQNLAVAILNFRYSSEVETSDRYRVALINTDDLHAITNKYNNSEKFIVRAFESKESYDDFRVAESVALLLAEQYHPEYGIHIIDRHSYYWHDLVKTAFSQLLAEKDQPYVDPKDYPIHTCGM